MPFPPGGLRPRLTTRRLFAPGCSSTFYRSWFTKVNITLKIDCVNVQILEPKEFQEIITRLTTIERKVDQVIMTQQEMDALLGKIDTTTNKLASNIQIIADTDQKISDEIDAFLAAAPVGTTLSDAQVA